MFRWVRIRAGLEGPPTSLRAHGYEVARLDQRVDGTWLATTRRHLDYPYHRTHVCQSFDTGKAGCEAWAQRHDEALLAWARAKHEAWVACQGWRKRDDAS